MKVVLISALLIASPAMAAETITYLHSDGIGSPVAATDQSGTLLWRVESQPYGTELPGPGAPAAPDVSFTGHQLDVDTGLIYMGARFYDPKTGRFHAMDPVPVRATTGSFNRYAYAENNPYRFVDPDGRDVVGASDEMNVAIQETLAHYKHVPAHLNPLQKLADNPNVLVIVKKGSKLTYKRNHDPSRPELGTITFDPRSGLEVDGGGQSPALGLQHEASHALAHYEGRTGSSYAAEEARVIRDVETPLARMTGEATRKRHGEGTPIPVKCVTCKPETALGGKTSFRPSERTLRMLRKQKESGTLK